MDVKTEELYKKCQENAGSGDIMGACKVMLELMDAKKLEIEEEKDQTYLEMAENLKPEDVRKVLQMSLKIRESGEIKDPELKNAASILIRAIEMS
jgi:predicted transcriptional regulator